MNRMESLDPLAIVVNDRIRRLQAEAATERLTRATAHTASDVSAAGSADESNRPGRMPVGPARQTLASAGTGLAKGSRTGSGRTDAACSCPAPSRSL